MPGKFPFLDFVMVIYLLTFAWSFYFSAGKSKESSGIGVNGWGTFDGWTEG